MILEFFTDFKCIGKILSDAGVTMAAKKMERQAML